MKRLFTLLLVTLCFFTVSFADETAGSVPVIRLEGNPTTGYMWTYEIFNPDVLAVEEQYHQREAPDGMLGVGGEYEFRLHGLQAGRTLVRFTYARSWENKRPLYTLSYRVKVDEDGNAVIIESGFQN